MCPTSDSKLSKTGVCLIFYPERLTGHIAYSIEHKGCHPMMGNDIYEGEAKIQDLMIAPPKDWKPWCFRGLAMASELVGDEEGECKECPWLTDCKKPKDGGQ